jgi:hypothetical protein
MIPLDECKEFHMYRGRGRNIGLSICTSTQNDAGFTGCRVKFDSKYLDTEVYYGQTSGTYQPLVDLGEIAPKYKRLWDRWRHTSKASYDLFLAANQLDRAHREAHPEAWKNYEKTCRERSNLPERLAYKMISRKARRYEREIMRWLEQTADNLPPIEVE